MTVNQSEAEAKSYREQLTQIKQYIGQFSNAQPEVAKAFSSLHKEASTPNQLDEKNKELIALAIAVAIRCDDCIAFHTHDALNAGASKDEIMEAVSVAVLMGGGPAMMYMTHVMRAIEDFEPNN
ncbi:alkylhydroperoxidase like protein, AhpD family [Halothece sp. PCC 7418]|uniref:carboxymuconolactone decarboxylase family protein n=1 Tax=Halothece sp. (strain PCC 7418) TaxID=65093 RepID=UPI0002A06134|nr:carboxymuconolactone decarboxylase family protein [Halothece sp. PCC 7418]AFZ45851.1 alkylhydroperoxidase like protein, AhpD family [Halothece sp. PCC 7418]